MREGGEIHIIGRSTFDFQELMVDKIQGALNDHTKPMRGSKVHIMGVAYKKNIDDVRESPALDIIHLLGERGAAVTYSDPYIPKIKADGVDMVGVEAMAACAAADCVVIVTDHRDFDYKAIVETSKLVVDTRNGLKGMTSDKIVRL